MLHDYVYDVCENGASKFIAISLVHVPQEMVIFILYSFASPHSYY